jgi:DNA-binding CsgD family transcriptional regulator
MAIGEIAGRLVLSIRTVGNYLVRVYRRLGISGRDELAAALAEAE